ncbi:putative bifunctional diguanylate cyclase/phosphodiesterase [Shewanella violacea]|uniref:GGDEF domain protein n=1 Tax=Shewanella violacea (strain JCM 10179 / CIP 106290 / LMG 19151 / DSS12) TaxID=637905 RepID=D4ZB05_SHEVD|nr:bifunctional diguanylate cyclase/phosphodiesterase [Shewanella violacea]BAJ03200.1 GGDEF domain protein [Shewanella violacea DSS12]
MESDWYFWVLGLICIAGIIIWYRHKKRETAFVQHLINLIQQPIDKFGIKPSSDSQGLVTSLDKIPKKYTRLYHELQRFIVELPGPSDKDKLTGLPNRLGVKSRLSGLSTIEQGSLVLIDIYRFRFVNDLFGFSVGDELLRQVSQRLMGSEPQAAYVARMNEDEFLIYFEVQQSESSLLALRERLQVPYEIEGSTISVQIQMGFVDLNLHHTHVSSLLRRLDLALIKAKSHKPFFASYALGDDLSQQRELSIIHDLPKALQQGQLYMVYQPKLDVALGTYVQVEALMRWQHSELGHISPGEFIPLAEYAGMIELLSQWALEQVIAQQARWQTMGIRLQVAVNLSTQDMISATLCDDIQNKLSRYGVSAGSLSIEITESQLMDDMDLAIATIEKLKEVGVDVAIDDFGTGHSSLAYLKNFPVDEVKIDKAFLDDLLTDKRAAHIMRSSIELAQGLGFSTTVEGVETQAVNLALIEMGVDKIQGDLFAKPMTAKEIEAELTG